ncbi:MAG: hypothetical protein JWN93_263 [Hyphomicrobiales bacterium]|jgi:hypothetical protein|nr:hypothetical protein [Hyphomicrobiales bacterium]
MTDLEIVMERLGEALRTGACDDPLRTTALLQLDCAGARASKLRDGSWIIDPCRSTQFPVEVGVSYSTGMKLLMFSLNRDLDVFKYPDSLPNFGPNPQIHPGRVGLGFLARWRRDGIDFDALVDRGVHISAVFVGLPG